MARVKFITFDIENGKYALPLDSIQQVMNVPEIMVVPETPECILGICNVRGEIVPVMDLESRLAENKSLISDTAKLIISSVGENKIALLVENMPDVVSEDTAHISTDFSNVEIHINPEFIKGIIDEKFLLILNIEKLVELK
ncbi:chemotaxis protein CheW [bacterium]|nr:chemotaxis protein CheW [bacterium]